MPAEARLVLKLESSANVPSGPPRQPAIPAGPNDWTKDVQRQRRELGLDKPRPPGGDDDPVQRMADLTADIRRQQIELARSMAPTAPTIWDTYFKPSSKDTRQSAAFASMGLGAAGMGGPAGPNDWRQPAIPAGPNDWTKDVQRQRRELGLDKPRPPGGDDDPVQRMADLTADIRRQQIELARSMAPTAPTIWDTYFKPSSKDTRQSAAFASMGLGAAGMGGPAAVVGGYAAMGPAGAALAAVDQFGKQIKQVTDSILSPIAAADPDAVARGFATMVEKVPIVGGLFGGLANSILDLSDSIFNTAKKLSAYSGPLALQQAMLEVRQIQHDMERAQRFGPQLQEAVEARFDFQEKLQDYIDEHMGDILKLGTEGLELLKTLLPLVTGLVGLVKGIVSPETTLERILSFGTTAMVSPLLAVLRLINQSTTAIEENIRRDLPLIDVAQSLDAMGRALGNYEDRRTDQNRNVVANVPG